MSKKIGAAIFGTGWVANQHITAYKKNPNCRIAAIGDKFINRAKEVAEIHKLDCRITDNFEDIINCSEVDAVSITTPNNTHTELGIKAARAGKHILIEKPIALNLNDAIDLEKEISTAKVKSLAGFVLHWNPLFRIIKKQLEEDILGKIFYVEIDYFHAVGPWYGQYGWNIKKNIAGNNLLTAGCHAVDAMLYFANDRVKEITSYSTRSDYGPFKEYEYDPTSVFICKFENGSIGKVACSLECNSPYLFNVLLMGEKGTIRNNQYYGDKCLGYYGHPEIGNGQTSWIDWPTILPDSGDVSHHPFNGEIDHFIDCIINDMESSLSISSAVHTHQICYSAEISANTGQPVKF